MEEYYTLSKPYDPQKLTPYSIRMLELYENGKPIGKKITVRADGAYSPEVEIVSKEADRALRDNSNSLLASIHGLKPVVPSENLCFRWIQKNALHFSWL